MIGVSCSNLGSYVSRFSLLHVPSIIKRGLCSDQSFAILRTRDEFLQTVVKYNSNISFEFKGEVIIPKTSVEATNKKVAIQILKKEALYYGKTGMASTSIKYLSPRVLTQSELLAQRCELTLSSFSQLGPGLYSGEQNNDFEIALYFGMQCQASIGVNEGISIARVLSRRMLNITEIPEEGWYNPSFYQSRMPKCDAFISGIKDFDERGWKQFKFNESSFPELVVKEDFRIIASTEAYEMATCYAHAIGTHFANNPYGSD